MTLPRTHAHTEHHSGRQDFTKTICVPKLCILLVNNRQQQTKHGAGHSPSVLHDLLILTNIVLLIGLNVYLGTLSVKL